MSEITVNFQNRIAYKGNIVAILHTIVSDFKLGTYNNHKIIEMGYEDFNLIVITDKGKYLIKIFADFKDEKVCKRYIEIMLKACEVGIKHPKLYKSSQGYLHILTIDGSTIRLAVMEYVDGKSFYELATAPTQTEIRTLAQQAGLINKAMDIKPQYVYDSWSITNFLKEYQEKKQYLEPQDSRMVAPVVQQFEKIELSTLPHSFVHGDMISTNVMRSTGGELYILDFSVSNYYPRIQELAVLFCDLFFDRKNPQSFQENYRIGLEEYQRQIMLTSLELEILPLYTKAAHAIHIMNPLYEQKVNGNNTIENNAWLQLGRTGLQFALDLWKR